MVSFFTASLNKSAVDAEFFSSGSGRPVVKDIAKVKASYTGQYLKKML